MSWIANNRQGLFTKIGPVLKLELLYDRAGRSEGTAFVHYERRDDALAAIREFNGANAKGTLGPRPLPCSSSSLRFSLLTFMLLQASRSACPSRPTPLAETPSTTHTCPAGR